MRLNRMFGRLVFFSMLVVVLIVGIAMPLGAQIAPVVSFQGSNVAAGQIIVRFRATPGVQAQTLAQDPDIVSTEPVGQTGAVLLRSNSRDVAALLLAYAARPDVVYAEPNYAVQAVDIPNDGFFNLEYALKNTGQVINYSPGTPGADIQAYKAWDITLGSRATVVGVVDTGIDYNHPDLIANIWSAPTAFTVTISGKTITCAAGTHGFNAITRTCTPLDDHFHGTHVSGIIGADGNNGVGVSGVNRIASIMGLKFLNSGGSGFISDAVAAMDFAIQAKAIFGSAANIRVLNNSWGGGGFSQAMLDEIYLADTSDMLFVAAAGNGALNHDTGAFYPASYTAPNVLSVAATDNNDALAGFSDYGATTVHIGAPGVNVASTFISNRYAYLSGTSMATPMVVGAAALVLSACSLSTARLKFDLLTTADPVPGLAGKTITGARLNVYRALTACTGTPPPSIALNVSPPQQTVGSSGSANYTVTVSPQNAFSGSVNLAVSGLPAGVTANFSSPSVTTSGSSVLTLTVAPSVSPGTYIIGITGSGGGATTSAGVSLRVGLPTLNPGTTISGSLSTTDEPSPQSLGSYADFYQITINSKSSVQVNLGSTDFYTYVYVLSTSGTVIAEGPGYYNATITASLDPGTYVVEVTSQASAVGNYTVSVNTPTTSSVYPQFGAQGSSLKASLYGSRFALPMTVSVSGTGVTVSNLIITGPETATAIFNIAPGATLGLRDVAVTTAEGSGYGSVFAVVTPFQTIGLGQTVTGALTSDDPASVYTAKSDFYALTLTSSAAIQIDLQSTAFNAYLFLYAASGGGLICQDDESGGNHNARIIGTLNPGTYFIQASTYSTVLGSYTLSVNAPSVTSLVPIMGGQSSSEVVTLTGVSFSSPMTIDAGSGIAVSGVNVINSASATATFTIAANAALGVRNVTATTSQGTVSAGTFTVFPAIVPITPGQTLSGALSAGDSASLDGSGARSDFFKLSLSSNASITIKLNSTAFATWLYLRSVSGGILFTDSGSAGNGNSTITASLAAGVYFVEATSFSSSATGSYTLSVATNAMNAAVPTLTAISPGSGPVGADVNVVLSGTGFDSSGMTINAGSGITVGNVSVTSPTSATATFSISVIAGTGVRNVSVATSGGTSVPATFTVNPPSPVLTSIDPVTGSPGMVVIATLLGGHLISPMTVDAGSGITVSNVTVTADSSANATFTISNNAALGTRLVTVTTADGKSNAVNFTVNALLPPVLLAVSPADGGRGATVNVALIGNNFASPLTLSAGSGITVSNVVITSSNSATATFTISASAAVTSRNVTVTTPAGTASLTNGFTVDAVALTSFTPSRGDLGTTFNVTLNGAGFAAPLTVNAGTDITVSGVSVVNSTTATATFTISPVATGGSRFITVNTAGTVSTSVLFIVNGLPPALTAITPSSSGQGASVSVTLNGTGFTSPMTVSAGSGITVSEVTVINSSLATAIFTITSAAPVGTHTIAASTGGGLGAGVPFTATTALPTLTGISPSPAGQGATVNVTLTGTNFSAPVTVSAGTGIMVSNVSVTSSTTATATFAISSDAMPGQRSVTLTTSGGTSNPINFMVLPTTPAEITSPVGGTVFSTTNVTFTRSNSSPVASAYYLWLGTTYRTNDVANAQMTGTTLSVSVPIGQKPVYATLWSTVNGTLYPRDYVYSPASAVPVSRVDFNGDLKSDLLLYNAASGQTVGWLMNGLNVMSNAVLLTDPNWKVTFATADLNGDGKADLLWYNAATGQTAAWLMNGLSTSSNTLLFTDPNWKITATADLNGDGKTDLIWYNAATGQTAAWLMNGLSVLSSGVLLTDPNWKITGIADLSGDGKADLLWFNAATGQTVAWLMNGLSVLSSGVLLTDPNWRITATADLSGDGKADLLLYNAATGQTAGWLMNGLSVVSSAVLLADPNWKVAASGDVNGDGRSDLLWFNAATGQTVGWLMNGLSVMSNTVLLTDPNWKITGTADLDGDGKIDLLWTNSATGQTVAWLMNGLSTQGNGVLLPDSSWKPVQN